MNTKYIALIAVTALLNIATAQDPAPILPEMTPEQKDQAQLNVAIMRVAQSLNQTAAVLTREHKLVWSLPDDRLLALLNENVQRTLAISAIKDKAAAEINSLLNQLNLTKYTNRAPIGFGRDDVKFDESTNQFVIIPSE